MLTGNHSVLVLLELNASLDTVYYNFVIEHLEHCEETTELNASFDTVDH